LIASAPSASISLFMDEPTEKQLRISSFAVHATRGVIRDQNVRRKTMFILLVIALVLLFSGSTFLASTITPGQHPVWFILFWFVCGWLTLTAMLLAFFDLLMVRLEARKARRRLQEKFSQNETPDSPGSTVDE
jgi:RsiW-degrading membrane proteinase PrsW (M82 family)